MIHLRVRLRAKLLLAFALVLLPVAILLWVDFRSNVVRQEQSILRDHELTAQAVAVQVDEAFDALIGFGWTVANDPKVLSAPTEALDAQLRELVTRVPQVDLIAVHDAHGATRGWSGPQLKDRGVDSRPNIAARADFQQVMALNLPQISDVLPLERLGTPGLVATVPIRDAQDQPIGVVVVATATEQLARRYEHARLLPGQAIWLADRRGRLAFHTGFPSMTFTESARMAEAEPLRSALAGIPTVESHFHGVEGDERLAAVVPSHKYRWGVGVTVPRSIALAPLREGFERELVAFGGILLVTLAMVVLFARLIVEPVRRLEIAATALGQGDLTRRVNIDSGDEVGRLGSAFDTMASQLTTLYDEQRQSLRLREDFMQAAAHELKTPISTIRSSVHLLLTDVKDPQDRRTLEIVRRQSKRMTLLVEDLLTVARLGTTLPDLHKTRIDLERLCDEATRRAGELAEKHTITFHGEGKLEVEVDGELIGVVLMRLLENAFGASPDGGPIDVTARREGREAVVTVADRGVGIPADRQAHIFEPFYEAVPSGRPGYVGVVSLRLHLCRRILDAHAGRIWFTSTPLEGSSFSFSLPLA
jgi:signal transduction histidine kinase